MEAGRRSPPITPSFGPLHGIRVVDSGRFVAGPWAATFLGEFGAEVIHVEGPPFQPPYSDPTRLLFPTLPEGAAPESSVSESWVQYGRNKLSLAADIARPEGRELFLDLLSVSDIWVESSRPGTYDKLGLSDATVLERNPRLTVVHVSGFGQRGDPETVRAPSFDLVGQAYSGFLSLQGEPDPQPPMRSGTALNDTVTGLAAATAGLMGHFSATRTGRGQVVDVAQYEVFFVLLENLALDYFARGVVRGRHGRSHPRLHPYDVYRARDGWVIVAAPSTASWERLARALSLTQPGWGDEATRRSQRTAIDAAIAKFCAERDVAELERLAREEDLAIRGVFDIERIAHDPHYGARGMFETWTDPTAGEVTGAGIAPKFQSTPGRVWRGAPWLGQDNRAVLAEILRYTPDRIDELERLGVVGSFRPRPAGRREPAEART